MPSNNFGKLIALTLGWVALAACSLAPPKSAAPAPQLAAPAQSEQEAGTPDSLREDYNRALAALKQGQDAEALRLFETLSRSHPELAAPSINIGLLALKRGDLASAETALQHAVSLKPELAVIHNGLGIVYRRQGRFAEAEAAYLKALQCAPDYPSAHLNLGILYDIYLGKLDAALEQYERYLALHGGDDDMARKWIIDLKQRLATNTGPSNR